MKNTRQRLTALSAPTLRDLIRRANDVGIARECVVTVMKENEAFIMLFYKDFEED